MAVSIAVEDKAVRGDVQESPESGRVAQAEHEWGRPVHPRQLSQASPSESRPAGTVLLAKLACSGASEFPETPELAFSQSIAIFSCAQKVDQRAGQLSLPHLKITKT